MRKGANAKVYEIIAVQNTNFSHLEIVYADPLETIIWSVILREQH